MITFPMYGESTDCADGEYAECEEPENGFCVGRAHANFVYELSGKTC